MTIHFETERLIGRAFDPERDAPAALRIYGDPEVTMWIGGRTSADVAEMRAFIEGAAERYAELGEPHCWSAAFLRTTGELVGAGLLKPLPDADGAWTEDVEVGWHVARACWGHGYATEIGRAMIRRGLDGLDVDVLHAVIDPGNDRSERVATKCGMTPAGRTSKYYGRTLLHYVIARPG